MTVALTANIARPISSALSTAFAMDNVGKLDAYGKLGATWSPLSLFANGEQGVFFDPSDLSTMFQDSAGTIPVTADGQPVGLILDKSGNGNHATAPNSSSRPLYRTDGTYHWLEFDGVDDKYATAPIDFTGTDKMSVFCGALLDSNSTYTYLATLGDGQEGTIPGGLHLFSGTNKLALSARGTLSTASRGMSMTAGSSAIPTTDPFIFSSVFDIAGADWYSSVPYKSVLPDVGYAWDATGLVTASGTFGNLPICISRIHNNTFKGNYYSLIFVGKQCTPEEITDTEAWVNRKTGAY